ncbi:MAG: hypothetical protein AB1846_19460 [Chloroflexota bacterium]
MNADTVRLILLGFLVAMFALSVMFLRERRLSAWAYALWGLLALLVPAVGPFLVIISRPGKPRHPRRKKRSLRP